MDQQHLLPEASEPVSDLEVRALIERFGERQAMAQGQPNIQDVAEALQVAPSTVAEMLQELRQSKNQDEIKQRLDTLERENAELRERTEIVSSLHTPFPDAGLRVPFLVATIVSIVVVIVATKVFAVGEHSWAQQFVAVAVLSLALFVIGRRLFKRERS